MHPCRSIPLAGCRSHRDAFLKRAATQLPLRYDFNVGPQQPQGSLSHPVPRDQGLFLNLSAAPSSSSGSALPNDWRALVILNMLSVGLGFKEIKLTTLGQI